MLKSILVAIDGSPTSDAALESAVLLARRHGAALAGIAALDAGWALDPVATPIGGGAILEHRNKVLAQRRATEMQRLRDAFLDRARDAGVEAGWVQIGDDPIETCTAVLDRHDMLVVGRGTDFRTEEDMGPAATAERLLQRIPRPLLLVPSPLTEGPIAIAYDASLPAARSMFAFAMLGLAEGREVHVVTVARKQNQGEEIAGRATAWLGLHGVAVKPHVVVADGNPADPVIGAVEGIGAGMLVMGGFGHEGLIRRLLSGSVSRRLLEESPVPVFVVH